jgi:ribonucleoside-diphosphate reductase alpha chain
MAKSDPEGAPKQPGGLTIKRRFSLPTQKPFEQLSWERRTAYIGSVSGETVFEQKDVEFPASWSQQATNVVASRYFRGTPGTPERERSVKQLISRVVETITQWGQEGGYFATPDDSEVFSDELTWLLVNQCMSFNSPVWFNVGVEDKPQCSACFINSVEDSMESILALVKTEGMLFKFGSGTGTNLSPLRSSKELLSGGGQSTGPVSFMRGYDAFAGAIKSGGKTRRAAKMVILNVDHPDIVEFIECKAAEERKAHALIDHGYDGSFGGEAYSSISFQNANHSVRATDAFMEAVLDDQKWSTRAVLDGQPIGEYSAREIMATIAQSAWECGDPGMQFDTTINDWHTCAASDRIYASNPCAEYMFLDDTACNLASLNLMRFVGDDGQFEVDAFEHAVDVTILAQEILVSNASYPTGIIAKNSEAFRPLGLGYANLGAWLMSCGLPYDSDAGRACAAAVTALMGGRAYVASANIARKKGAFSGYSANAEAMLAVIEKHRRAARALDRKQVSKTLHAAARKAWDEALEMGKKHGYRNSQVTVLAPTGTIAFMMDCDTTGVEPDIALVKYKQLAEGGLLRMVNRTVAQALQSLGVDAEAISRTLHYIEENDTIEGAPDIRESDLPVFDCAFRPAGGTRSIAPMGHVKMMAATQPFLSGAISKTVNLPADATVQEIEEIYMAAWKLGLKAIAIYRDGCKRSQPLSTQIGQGGLKRSPARRKLEDERESITHKFNVGGHKGYITVGKYPDGTPGEIFIIMAKQGSTVGGLMDAFATSISMALQYGVPLEELSRKFVNMRFEPSGFTTNSDIPMAKSIVDYIFRWLSARFPVPDTGSDSGAPSLSVVPSEKADKVVFIHEADAPTCPDCGTLMVRNGACHKCLNCGGTSGCS